MSYERILAGVDGSDGASRALALAARLAKTLGAHLEVVAVGAESGVLEEAGRIAGAEEGLEAGLTAREGNAAEALIETAGEQGADLVVLGSRGLGGGPIARLGSVPNKVAHMAPSDVLIVRTDDARELPPAGYARVLIATDGSSTADRACLRGIELVRDLKIQGRMLYVGHPVTGKSILDETLGRLATRVPISPVTREGDPAKEIVAVAQEQEADLIVVGNRGLEHGKRLTMGVVPDKVSRSATTDVLIARTASLSLDDLAPGEGAVISDAGVKLAVRRLEDGAVEALSARCQHLGCTVGWNATERTWDCPCHGSRYEADGSVKNGPTTRPLPKVEL